jgi:tungstate transport system substrate-binding protein
MTARSLLFAIAISALVAACGRDTSSESTVRLATTTSTENSGLLGDLLPPFEKRERIEVRVIAVGTGQALELGRRGDVDLVLVHARKLEDEFVASGHGIDRRDVMWNDFAIAGPPADPAGIRGLGRAAEALRRIREAEQPFVSRGDNSGTHVRELSLWERAGGAPKGRDFYLEAGQGMGKCLLIADEKRGYILVDRGTYLAFRRKLDLEILVEGDPLLHNPYGMILVNPKRHPHVNAAGAKRLLDYITSPEGQQRIGAFRASGQLLFHPVDTR